MPKSAIGRATVIAILTGIGLIIYAATRPKPGTFIPSLGRDHVPSGTPVTYNSNPPTSGPHNEKWERAGIYDQVLPDEKLVHSLEHGYVIISYNCGASPTASIFPPGALAHEAEEPHDEPEATAEAQPDQSPENPSVPDISQWPDDPDCWQLVAQLREVANQVGLTRLIIVPLPNLDSRIALTAWTRIEKMDNVDKSRIIKFIKAWRNKGPEKTME